jgi:hypothetical protein
MATGIHEFGAIFQCDVDGNTAQDVGDRHGTQNSAWCRDSSRRTKDVQIRCNYASLGLSRKAQNPERYDAAFNCDFHFA